MHCGRCLQSTNLENARKNLESNTKELEVLKDFTTTTEVQAALPFPGCRKVAPSGCFVSMRCYLVYLCACSTLWGHLHLVYRETYHGNVRWSRFHVRRGQSGARAGQHRPDIQLRPDAQEGLAEARTGSLRAESQACDGFAMQDGAHLYDIERRRLRCEMWTLTVP